MNEEIKTKWVEALRSGKYKQCDTMLFSKGTEKHPENAYCCLGVLSEISAGNSVYRNADFSWNGEGWVSKYNTSSVEKHVLPLAIIYAVGLTGADADLLINMNDVQKSTFDEIASHIEGNL